MSASPLTVQLVLHGQVASYAGDMPVTSTGLLDAGAAGRSLAAEMDPNEIVCFHHWPKVASPLPSQRGILAE